MKNNGISPEESLKDDILKVSEMLRGHFRLEQTALLILPQIFVFRFHRLIKEEALPLNYLRSLKKINDMPLNSFRDLCNMMNAINRCNLREISGALTPFLHEFELILEDDFMEEIFKRLNKINYSSEYLSNKEFGKSYSELITSLFKISRIGSENSSSRVSQNILSSLKLTPGFYKVLDPTFGIGNSITRLFHNQRDGVGLKIYGYETDRITSSYAIMNLICNGIYTFNLKNTDALSEDWALKFELFDLIISDAPIKKSKRPDYLSVSIGLINKALDNLSNNGRALFLVSDDEIHLQNYRNDITSWVKNNLLSGVVSLPHSLGREDLNVPVSILFFDKTNKYDNVNFIDLRDDKKFDGKTVLELSEKPIFSKKFDSKHQATPNKKEIEQRGFDLHPKYYVGSIHKEIKKLREENRAIPLSEILTPIKRYQPSTEEFDKYKSKVLKIRDLKDDPFDYTINASSIITSYSDVKKKTVSMVSTDCILIANEGESFKPTYVKADSSFLIDKGIFAYKINDSVQIDYLVKQLHTSFVRDQARTLQSASTVPFLSIPRFLEIVLEIPKGLTESNNFKKWHESEETKTKLLESLRAEQIDWSDIYEAEWKKSKSKNERIERIKHEKEEQEEELIDYVNHSVRNSLSVVKDSIELLYDYMIDNEGEPINLKAPEGKPLEGEDTSELSTISDLFTYSINGLNRALKSLKNLEDYRVDKFSEDDLKIENVYELLISFRDNVSHSKNYDFIVDTKEDTNFLKSRINKDAMFNVLDNLLENAERHGFRKENSKFTVLFDVSIDGDNVVIDYKNDGEPMLISDIEKFTSRGISAGKNAGSGFGGFFINRTLQKLNGDLILCKAEKYSRWNIHFKIELPLEKGA